MKLTIGNVTLENNLILAPMAGVTDLPFRLLCKEQGAGLLCTEMVSAKAIYFKNKNTKSLMDKKETSLSVMADFNSPASVRGEGYDLVRVSGFKDTWDLAEKKDAGFTAPPKIDGWKEAEGKSPEKGMRIDYIWHWGDINIEESRVLCNGKREPAVSDHYAVMIKTGI